MMTTKRILLVAIIAMVISNSCFADDWMNWRGPKYDGSSKESDLPSSWSQTENVRWKTAMPGAGYSTPVVAQGKVFLTAQSDDDKSTLVALCLDVKTGKVLWKKDFGQGGVYAGRNEGASSSAVTDGKNVYFTFGTGRMVGLTLDGKVLWELDLQKVYGEFVIKFGFSSTPLLLDGKLYVAVMQGDKDNQLPTKEKPSSRSYLLALDALTGKELWKQTRPCVAPRESQESYTSPLPIEVDGKTQIVLMGGDCLTGHDPKDGEELWRWTGYNKEGSKVCRVISSPVIYGDTIVACRPRHKMTYAFKPSGKKNMDLTDVLWSYEGGTDATTPLYYKKIVYLLDGDRKRMIALKPKSGEELWTGQLDNTAVYRASATAGDGKVYVINEEGVVTVLKAGKKFEILSVIKVGAPMCRSSLTIADAAIFVRTASHLYCVEQQ